MDKQDVMQEAIDEARNALDYLVAAEHEYAMQGTQWAEALTNAKEALKLALRKCASIRIPKTEFI